MAVTLSKGYKALAFQLQEAGMFHSDVQARLSDTLRDMTKESGEWCCYVTHDGDGSSGSVIYSCDGNLCKAPYAISETSGKASCSINMDKAVDVVASVTYKTEAIQEAEIAPAGAGLKLVESYSWEQNPEQSEALRLIESTGSEMTIKLIAPGKGSSAFYPAEVLKRDGPSVFKAGTQIYINHATAAEEASRPEGDWHKLAGALSTNAYWDESAKQGPGLYAKAKFASDLAPAIKEKAPYTGMSIRAEGVAESNTTRDGVPVLKSLTRAESVDVVTRAGAGGMILTESARDAATKEPEMDQAAVQQLIEAANAPLIERAIKAEAREEGVRILESVSLPAAAKTRVLNEVIAAGVPRTANAIDMVKFNEALNGRAKTEAEYLSQIAPHRVTGFGAAPVQIDTQEAERREKAVKLEEADNYDVFSRLIGGEDEVSKKAARMAARGRAA